MEQRSSRSSLLDLEMLSIMSIGYTAQLIPITGIALYPVIQSASMWPDGKRLAELMYSADGAQEPALADLDLANRGRQCSA